MKKYSKDKRQLNKAAKKQTVTPTEQQLSFKPRKGENGAPLS